MQKITINKVSRSVDECNKLVLDFSKIHNNTRLRMKPQFQYSEMRLSLSGGRRESPHPSTGRLLTCWKKMCSLVARCGKTSLKQNLQSVNYTQTRDRNIIFLNRKSFLKNGDLRFNARL